MTTYFGFALADGMFAGNCIIKRTALTSDEAKALITEGIVPCLNPSHKSTIDAMNVRFGIYVPIPETPPKVLLQPGMRSS